MAAATPQTGNADVDAFLADIAANRREAAIGRVVELNSISGQPNAVSLVDEFVDKLLHCSFVSSQMRGFGSTMYDIQWRCPDGYYFSLLDPGYRPPRLVVGEFLSAEAREARRCRPTIAPPTPPSAPAPSSDAAVIRIVTDYLADIGSGGSGAGGFNTTFRLHFTDNRQPDSFIGPAQLGHYLARCRLRGPMQISAERVIGRWDCPEGEALAGEIMTVMSIYTGRVVAGMVLVGSLSEPAS